MIQRLLVASLVMGQVTLFPSLPSTAEFPCARSHDIAPASSSREIRIDKYRISFKIPANYRTKSRTYSTNQAIDIFNPSAYAYSNCLREKKVGIDGDSASATVLIGVVNGRSLTKIANDLHCFRTEISSFEKVAIASQQGIEYNYSVIEATHVGYLFLAPEEQHFIAIGYSLNHPDSNQETANRIINSFTFQQQ